MMAHISGVYSRASTGKPSSVSRRRSLFRMASALPVSTAKLSSENLSVAYHW